MRRLFESFLVLQGRSTGTTPMAGASLVASLFACSLFDPLSRRRLAHSFACCLGRPARPFARPLGRWFARSLGRARARHLALFLPLSIVRSFACLRTLARSLAGSAPCALARVRTCVLAARVRAIVRSCSVARPLVRFACSVARSVGHSFPWSLGCPYARSLCR